MTNIFKLQGCHVQSKPFSQIQMYKHGCKLPLTIDYLKSHWAKPMTREQAHTLGEYKHTRIAQMSQFGHCHTPRGKGHVLGT